MRSVCVGGGALAPGLLTHLYDRGHCGWPSVPPLADVSIGSVVRTPLDPGYVAAAGCVGILLTEHAA